MVSFKQFLLIIPLLLSTALSFAYPVTVTHTFKHWNGSINMQDLEKNIRAIQVDTLEWLTSKYQDLGYGITKLHVTARVDSEFEKELEMKLDKLAGQTEVSTDISFRAVDSIQDKPFTGEHLKNHLQHIIKSKLQIKNYHVKAEQFEKVPQGVNIAAHALKTTFRLDNYEYKAIEHILKKDKGTSSKLDINAYKNLETFNTKDGSLYLVYGPYAKYARSIPDYYDQNITPLVYAFVPNNPTEPIVFIQLQVLWSYNDEWSNYLSYTEIAHHHLQSYLNDEFFDFSYTLFTYDRNLKKITETSREQTLHKLRKFITITTEIED